MAAALAPRYPGVAVATVDIVEIHEVTNTHVRLRVGYDHAAGAPETFFAKLQPLDPARRAPIARTRMGRREVSFYTDLAPLLALRVPAMHVARYDDSDDSFIMLMEDLTAHGCWVSDGAIGVPVDAAAHALQDLAAMHVRFENHHERAAHAGWVVPTERGTSDYGATLLQYGLDHHRDRLSAEFATIARLYIDEGDTLYDVWHPGPVTVVHGDPHLGNVFIDGDRVGFLDWGLINLGNPMRDVSYFITMALAVDDRRQHERELLRGYVDARAALGGMSIDFERAWHDHCVQAAYTVVACCQLVTFPDDISLPRQVFADAFLARAEAAICDLDAVGALRAAGVGGH